MKRLPILALLCSLLVASFAFGRGDDTKGKQQRPQLRKTGEYTATGFSHKVGALWSVVTNYGFYGDRAYSEPNFEWPGGSGNIYGWLQSIWIGAIVDSLGYVSSGENNQFTPLDSIHVKHAADGSLSAEDTYTRYTDMNPPSPTGVHMNLGVEVSEHTYVWDQSYNDDFIICDYWIKYNVFDRNGDGVVTAVDSVLSGVYVGFRMDADVSGFNGSNTDSYLWDQDDLAGYDSTSKTVYVYDSDSPNVPGDDTGNPDPVSGGLRSPGYIGISMLYFDSAHFVGPYTGKPNMATPSYRYFEPATSQAMYEFLSKSGITTNATVIRDYRAIMGVGPFRIPAGDSIHVVVAWVVGYGFKGVTSNAKVAQTMFDGNYQRAPSAPEVPNWTLQTTTANNQSAIVLSWNKNSEQSADPLTGKKDFDGYGVYKASRVDANGALIWDTLAIYPKSTLDPVNDSIWIGRPFVKTWPPPMVIQGNDTTYQYLDVGTPNGMIYNYAITAFDKGDTLLGLGRLENQVGRGRTSTKVYMANAAPAQSVNNIRVVPNPYMGSSSFNNPKPVDTNPWVNRIRFVNLPKDATINIFTLAGDLVKTIHSGDVVYVSRDATVGGDFSGIAEWDLITKNRQEAVSGVYIYVVQSPAGSKTGKFVIMR